MGVVYYANYLRFFEGARGHFIRNLGLSYRRDRTRGILLPCSRRRWQYLKSARYDDVLVVHCPHAHAGEDRFDYKVHRQADDAILALGHTVHVSWARS